MPDGLSVREWMDEQEFNDIIEAVAAESMPEDAPQFQIIDYSEKAIAVVGDTRDIKDKLKALGGRFNPRLSCGAGWIFSKKQRAKVEVWRNMHRNRKQRRILPLRKRKPSM